jgi:hypothetical protein
MIALEVKINGKVVTVAGRKDLCVLNAMIGAIGSLGSQPTSQHEKLIEFNVCGVAKDTELNIGSKYNWLPKTELGVGDEISIKIVNTDSTSIPVSSSKHDHNQVNQIRSQLESLRAS